MATISFTINKEGDIKINTVTGAGGGCQELTNDVEKLLGNVDQNSRAATQDLYVPVDPLTLKQDAQ